MAKKKQFAGKKTKLARLPLTQALASQAEEEALWSSPPNPPLAVPTQIPLTWDEVSAGRGEPLATAFLALVRELAELKGALHAPQAVNHRTFLPDGVPQAPRIMRALLQARQSLLDLQNLLSHR
jgi:hypothetical protein